MAHPLVGFPLGQGLQPFLQVEAAGRHMDRADQSDMGAVLLQELRDRQVPLQVHPGGLAGYGGQQVREPLRLAPLPAAPFAGAAVGDHAVPLQAPDQLFGVHVREEIQAQLGQGVRGQAPGAVQGLVPGGMGEGDDEEGQEGHGCSRFAACQAASSASSSCPSHPPLARAKSSTLLEPLSEALHLPAQGPVGIHALLAGPLHEAEEHVPELVLDPLGIALRLQLRDLFAHLVQDPLQVGPLEAHLGAALADLQGFVQGRQALGDAIQQAGVGVVAQLRLLGPLDGGPVDQDLLGALHVEVPEDMGMAAYQLGHDVPLHVMDVPGPAFLGQLGVEEHLEPEVPQLFPQVALLLLVSGDQGRQSIQDLGRLLPQVALQGVVILLQVPGTALLGLAEGGHHGAEGLRKHDSSVVPAVPDSHCRGFGLQGPEQPLHRRGVPGREGRSGQARSGHQGDPGGCDAGSGGGLGDVPGSAGSGD